MCAAFHSFEGGCDFPVLVDSKKFHKTKNLIRQGKDRETIWKGKHLTARNLIRHLDSRGCSLSIAVDVEFFDDLLTIKYGGDLLCLGFLGK